MIRAVRAHERVEQDEVVEARHRGPHRRDRGRLVQREPLRQILAEARVQPAARLRRLRRPRATTASEPRHGQAEESQGEKAETAHHGPPARSRRSTIRGGRHPSEMGHSPSRRRPARRPVQGTPGARMTLCPQPKACGHIGDPRDERGYPGAKEPAPQPLLEAGAPGERLIVTGRGRPVAVISPPANGAAERRIRLGGARWAGGKPLGPSARCEIEASGGRLIEQGVIRPLAHGPRGLCPAGTWPPRRLEPSPNRCVCDPGREALLAGQRQEGPGTLVNSLHDVAGQRDRHPGSRRVLSPSHAPDHTISRIDLPAAGARSALKARIPRRTPGKLTSSATMNAG